MASYFHAGFSSICENLVLVFETFTFSRAFVNPDTSNQSLDFPFCFLCHLCATLVTIHSPFFFVVTTCFGQTGHHQVYMLWWLKESGAHCNAVPKGNRTALHWAADSFCRKLDAQLVPSQVKRFSREDPKSTRNGASLACRHSSGTARF
jgi:hypothetical protein